MSDKLEYKSKIYELMKKGNEKEISSFFFNLSLNEKDFILINALAILNFNFYALPERVAYDYLINSEFKSYRKRFKRVVLLTHCKNVIGDFEEVHFLDEMKEVKTKLEGKDLMIMCVCELLLIDRRSKLFISYLNLLLEKYSDVPILNLLAYKYMKKKKHYLKAFILNTQVGCLDKFELEFESFVSENILNTSISESNYCYYKSLF